MNLDQPSPAPNSNPVLWELVIADMRERDRIDARGLEAVGRVGDRVPR